MTEKKKLILVYCLAVFFLATFVYPMIWEQSQSKVKGYTNGELRFERIDTDSLYSIPKYW
jgi:hypothetical protein